MFLIKVFFQEQFGKKRLRLMGSKIVHFGLLRNAKNVQREYNHFRKFKHKFLRSVYNKFNYIIYNSYVKISEHVFFSSMPPVSSLHKFKRAVIGPSG